MNWLQTKKLAYSLKVFKTRARKVKFPHQFVDFKNAKRIGLLVNLPKMSGDEIISFSRYLDALEADGKQVLVVELNFLRKSEPMFAGNTPTIFINPSHLNWLDFPSVPMLREINKFKCDIFFNLDTSPRMSSRFICGLSNAKMRVGVHSEDSEGYYELMLQMKEEAPLQEVLQTFERYSKMLEK